MICSQQLWNNSILDYEKDKSTVKNIYHKGWIDFNKNGRTSTKTATPHLKQGCKTCSRK